MSTPPSWGRGFLIGEEPERVDVESLRDSFDGLQREVAFSSFDPAHVGAVDLQHVGKGFLAEALLEAAGSQAPAQAPLQLSFHRATIASLLLLSLHTDE